jgi:hypothetical protein
MNLREWARGQPCQVRLIGCDGGVATTVLAHLRRASTAGVGQKPPDLCAVIACAYCHDVIDGRIPRLEADGDFETLLLDALLRTLALVWRKFDVVEWDEVRR